MEEEYDTKLELGPITAFIPKSQNKKYQIHNVQIYESGEIKNITTSSSMELSEFHTILKDLLPRGRVLHKGPTFKTKTALNITHSIQEYVKNVHLSQEVFLGELRIGKDHKNGVYLGEEIAGKIEDRQDSMTLNDFYELKKLTEEEHSSYWSPNEIIQGYKMGKDKIKLNLLDLFVDHSLTIEMNIYVALPFSENFLGNDPRSPHAEFLEKFQEQYQVERPWRYTCVKNWLLIPRFNLDGETFFDLEEITNYARNLRYEVWNFSENQRTFQSIERLYAYLQFVREFTSEDYIHKYNYLRIGDQVQFRLAQEYESEDIEDLIDTLNDFFSSSVAYVNSLASDLKALSHVKSLKARLDESFVQQSVETIRYLLKEHKIADHLDSLEKYVEEHSQTYLPLNPQEILFPRK